MKTVLKLSVVALSLALAACSDDDKNEENLVQDEVFGPIATGSSSDSYKVYFDLDTGSTVELTDEEAATDTTWDIAIERYKVYLNGNNADDPVAIYNTNNNADFYDADGKAVSDMFINATPEAELQDFLDVSAADIPSDDTMFVPDVSVKTITDWYSYDFTTHATSAAAENYFVVKNNDVYSKFSVTSLTLDGYDVTDISLGIQYDLPATEADVSAASNNVQTLAINMANECGNGETAVYVDFMSASIVAADAAHDLTLSCDNSIISMSIDMAESATGMQDFDNGVNSVEYAAIYEGYSYFAANWSHTLGYSEVAKGSFGSTFVYGVNGGHTLWSDYNVYIVKSGDNYFKVQFTSYYDDAGTSGSISFRSELLEDAQ